MASSEILITDLSDPAFHTEKVLRRLEKPFLVASLITKNPGRLKDMLSSLPLSVRQKVSLQVTVTGLGGTEWEPAVPKPKKVLEDVKGMLDVIPASRISLRYDPIIPFENSFPWMYRSILTSFWEIGVRKVTASVLDVYRHVRERLKKKPGRKVWRLPETFHYPDHIRKMVLDEFISVAEDIGYTVRICCEEGYTGRQRSGCDWIIETLEEAYGKDVDLSVLMKGTQRQNCGCPKMSQILTYDDRCFHGCIYCYRKS